MVINLKPENEQGTGRVGRVSPPLGDTGMGNHHSPMTGTRRTLMAEECESLRRYQATIPRKRDLIEELYHAQRKQHLSSRKEQILQEERKI